MSTETVAAEAVAVLTRPGGDPAHQTSRSLASFTQVTGEAIAQLPVAPAGDAVAPAQMACRNC